MEGYTKIAVTVNVLLKNGGPDTFRELNEDRTSDLKVLIEKIKKLLVLELTIQELQ